MSGYKRIISYIYAYEKGERKENTGFAKLEARNGSCRIAIHLRGFYVHGQRPYPVYLYALREGRLQGVLLGELQNSNGALEWKGCLGTEELKQLPFDFNEVRGLLIDSLGEKRFASDWDDYPVNVDSFQVYRPEQCDDGEKDLTEESESEEVLLQAAEVDEIEIPAETELPDEEKQSMPVEDIRREKWEYLTRHFPVQQLFQSGRDAMDCIRIGPRDLQRLPRDSWILGNNSFLLHGYYQYRHLLLCRQEQNGTAEYYLGVPGIYNEKEQMMANLFGFEEFRRNAGAGNREGNFGYWFRRIEET